ncbi:hypothetical protein [Ectobacillus funiculus]|uniref:hypothetical protein n=1 Tax=Ectobacillus funiculus TaxID=137993 RepID=UPI00101C7C48|nr:hypothetical protein [Ectobacillus funiculus]
MKRRIGVFTVLLSCSLALFACSAKQETNGQATTTTDSPSSTSNTETKQTEVEPVKELKSVETMKKETQEFWESLKNVDAPKLNESVQTWDEYYAKPDYPNRLSALNFTSSSFEGKSVVTSFSIAPHSATAGYDTIMSLQDGIAIAKNLLPKGYDQKEETFSILYLDAPALLTYQVEYVANGSVPKESEHFYLVFTYNNLGITSVSMSKEKRGYNQPEMGGKYTYLKPDLVGDEAALKNLTEVQSKQDVKQEYIVQ